MFLEEEKLKHKNAVERIIHAHRNSALSLDLSGMQLDYIPKEIGMLDKLEYLDLSHNNVPDLPDEILNLKSLKKLFLTKNNFRDFPSGLCNLESLEMFSLKHIKVWEINN